MKMSSRVLRRRHTRPTPWVWVVGRTKMGLGLWMVILVGTVFLAPTTSARRRDRTAPHDHRGKLAPYPAGPFPALRLTASDEATLQSGHPVTKQSVPSGSGKDDDKPGTVLCIQDVQAPLAAVWHQILGMDDYSKKVSKVTECRNYFVSKLNASGQVRIKTKQVLGVLPGYSFESYYDHTFHPARSSLTWCLDYDKTSDLDDVSGHWHVEPHPQHPTDCSRVFYACDVQMKGAVPKPLLNYMSKTALRQATAWVKKESEAHPDRTVSAQYGGHLLPQPKPLSTSLSSSSSSSKATTATDKSVDRTPRRLLWGLL